jgi:hypothetical protein
MSDLEQIVDRIIARVREDAAAPGMVGMVKSEGNPSVAYLPGGFSTMKNMMRSLAPVKKKWNIDVLEKEDGYHVKIEDAMDIIVPLNMYEEFNTKVIPIKGKKDIDLAEMVNEARTEEVHGLYDRLTHVLTIDLRENRQVKRTLVLMNYWLTIFKNSKFLPMSGQVAIQLNTYDKSIRDFADRIQNIHTDDIGTLEMIIDTIQQDRPLNAYEPFAEYDYLVGCRIQSNYNGVVMIFELTVNMAMIATQSIYIESQEVLDELGSYRTVKVLEDMVFPMGEMFRPSIFNNIKDIIDDHEDLAGEQ